MPQRRRGGGDEEGKGKFGVTEYTLLGHNTGGDLRASTWQGQVSEHFEKKDARII